MASNLVSVGAFNTGTSASPMALAKPTTINDTNDVIAVVIKEALGITVADSVTGMTFVKEVEGSYFTYSVWRKDNIADGASEPSTYSVVSTSSPGPMTGFTLAVVRGSAFTFDVADLTTIVADTSIGFGDFTTTTVDETVVYIASAATVDRIIATSTIPAGSTLIGYGNSGTPSAHSAGAAYEVIASPSTVTGKTWDAVATSNMDAIIASVSGGTATVGIVLSGLVFKNGPYNSSGAGNILATKTLDATFEVAGTPVSGAPATIATDGSGETTNLELAVSVDDVVTVKLDHPDLDYSITFTRTATSI